MSVFAAIAEAYRNGSRPQVALKDSMRVYRPAQRRGRARRPFSIPAPLYSLWPDLRKQQKARRCWNPACRKLLRSARFDVCSEKCRKPALDHVRRAENYLLLTAPLDFQDPKNRLTEDDAVQAFARIPSPATGNSIRERSARSG